MAEQEKTKITHTVMGDIDEIDHEYPEENETDGEAFLENESSPESDCVCKRSCKFKRLFTRENFPRLLIWLRYLFPVVTGFVLFVLSFGDLFTFYQSATVGTISIFGLFGATFETLFTAFGQITDSTVVWYAVLQLAGAVIGIVGFLLAGGFSILAAVAAFRTFTREPNHPLGNRMKVIFKIAFPNRICLFLANAAYLLPFLYPYWFSLILERFYYMGVEPEPPIYVKSNPCFWVAFGLTVVNLVLAVVIARFERSKRMNLFLVEHSEEN